MANIYKRAGVLSVLITLLAAALFYSATPVRAAASDDFVTTWKTDNAGTSNSTSITIPVNGSPGYNYGVDWDNNGTVDQTGITGSVTHDFGVAGTYTIRISGTFKGVQFSRMGDADKIIKVNQWGTAAWSTMTSAFAGCHNLDVIATDVPDLSGVTDLNNTFYEAESLVGNSSFGSWNTSTITEMGATFYSAHLFNQNISTWDMSHVTSMSYMLAGAYAFNQDIGGWNTSSATTMERLFDNASVFNQNISGWNTANVVNMSGMFSNAQLFNQDISGWDTSKVTDMSWMFGVAAAFNQDLSAWDTSSVTNMACMFYIATSFNQPIGIWDTSNVTDMTYMFRISPIDQDLSAWDTSKVTSMAHMFLEAPNIDQDFSSWDVHNVTDMTEMFTSTKLSTANYDATLAGWSAQALKNNVVFDAGTSRYCDVAHHDSIISTFNWTINDGGLSVCPAQADLSVTTSDAQSTIVVGSPTYAITQTVTNNGPASVDTIHFLLSNSQCITIGTVDMSGSATNTGSYVDSTWTGVLEPGQNIVMSFNVDLSCAAGNNVEFTNSIVDLAFDNVALTDTDPNNETYADTTEIVPITNIDLAITTSDDKTTVPVTSPTYAITQTVTNNGPASVDTIHFLLSNSQCITIGTVDMSGSATNTGSYVDSTWTGVLEPGQNIVMSFNVDLSCAAGNNVEFTNSIVDLAFDNVALTDTDPNNETYADTTEIKPVTDVEVTKVLQNPGDLAEGATLTYDLTLTNHGPSPLDLSQYNFGDGNPFNTALFIDFMPPQLNYVAASSSNPDVSCFVAGASELLGGLMADHTGYSIIVCSYSGSSVLTAEQSVSTSISATVASSDLTFANYVTSAQVQDDPDLSAMTSPFTGDGACEAGSDILTCYRQQHLNNMAVSDPVADLDLALTLNNQSNIHAGDEVSYDLTVQNKGPMSLDATQLMQLFTLFYRSDDFVFSGTDTTGLVCQDYGPGSIAGVGAAAADHQDYQVLGCASQAPGGDLIAPGDTHHYMLKFLAKNTVGSTIKLYAVSSNLATDPDAPALLNDIFTAEHDILDTIQNDNFARLAHTNTAEGFSVVSLPVVGGKSGIICFIVALTASLVVVVRQRKVRTRL